MGEQVSRDWIEEAVAETVEKTDVEEKFSPEIEESYRVRRLCQERANDDKTEGSRLWNEWREAGRPPFEKWIAR